MTILWIIAAIVLLLLLFRGLFQPQQGAIASNAPKRTRPDALSPGTESRSTPDRNAIHPTDGRNDRSEITTDDIATATQLLEAEVQQFLVSGQKIAAIKRVRAVKQWRLREAKDYVEALERHEPPPMPVPPTTWNATPELRQEALRLLTAHKKLVAIKWVREQTRCSLYEAKQYVEAIQREEFRETERTMPPDWPDPALWREVEELLAANQMFEAVERIRQVTGWELRQSLEYVTKVQQSRY